MRTKQFFFQIFDLFLCFYTATSNITSQQCRRVWLTSRPQLTKNSVHYRLLVTPCLTDRERDVSGQPIVQLSRNVSSTVLCGCRAANISLHDLFRCEDISPKPARMKFTAAPGEYCLPACSVNPCLSVCEAVREAVRACMSQCVFSAI